MFTNGCLGIIKVTARAINKYKFIRLPKLTAQKLISKDHYWPAPILINAAMLKTLSSEIIYDYGPIRQSGLDSNSD